MITEKEKPVKKASGGEFIGREATYPSVGEAVAASSSWAGGRSLGSRQRRGSGAVTINSQLGCSAYVWLHTGIAVQMRVTCLDLFPFWKFSSRITVALLTITNSFQRSNFRKMQRAAECLTKSHLVSEGCLFSDMSLSLKQTRKIPMPVDRCRKALLQAVSETSPCRISKVKVSRSPTALSELWEIFCSLDFTLTLFVGGGEASQAVRRPDTPLGHI